jgi:hypothetical protein
MKKRKNIPGIHNYCDRWCERCTFTSCCAVAEMDEKLSPEQRDIHNKAFWDNLSKNFAKAFEMLQKSAEKWGIDLNEVDSPESNAAYERKENDIRAALKKHPLSKLGKQYAGNVNAFLKNNPSFEETGDEVIRHFEMGLLTENEALQKVSQLKDCTEVIRWFEHFIYIKLQRALSGLMEDDGWEEANGFQRDCDGSAKIVLIATEKSLQAWVYLHGLFPGKEDEILQQLSLLQQIKRLTEESFPKAWRFKRPGFDD